MTIFEEIRNALRDELLEEIGADRLSMIEDKICLILGKWDCKIKETSLVVFDETDSTIMKRFFLAKGVQGCTKNTAETYRAILGSFFSTTMMRINDVTPDDVRIYIARKKVNGVSDNYLATIHRTLSSFFSWCYKEELISSNPMLRVEKIKISKKDESALTEEQMESLRYSAKTKREKALIEFLYSTGCRISEVVSLKSQDVDLVNSEILVLGKGRKYRRVYLSNRAKFALIDYLESRNDSSPFLFTYDLSEVKYGLAEHIRGRLDPAGGLGADGARTMIRNIGKRCGLYVHPHLLRKTVATIALGKGMPIDQVREMLGHESIATTTIYAQTHGDEIKRSHAKFV